VDGLRDLVVKSSLEVTNGNITVRQSFAEVIGEATQLENDLGALNKAYSEGKDVTRELANVTSTLAKIQANEATQSADQLRGRIDTLASSATLATEEMAKLRKESLLAQASALTALQTSRGTYDGVFRDADMTIQGEGGRFIPSNPATPTSRPNLLDFDQDKVKKERGGGKKNDDYKNETRSIREQTEALQAAYDAQSTLNVSVNDYGYAVAYAKAETDLLQAAQRDGKTVNSALKTEIAGLAESYAEATVQQAKLNEEQKKAKASIESAKSAMTGFLSTFQQGLRNGEGFWKSFGNAAMGILDKIISKLNDQVVDAIFSSFSGPSSSGGSGGGFLSGFISLFSAKGNAFTQGGNVKAFANGGVVNGATPFNYSGGLGVMGEAGPEAIMPLKRNGNGQLGVVAANSNNPVNAPVSITIDATGADAAGLARVEKRLAALQQTLPNTIVKTVKQAEARRAL
jgi:lambda family phage tail tape measure protein